MGVSLNPARRLEPYYGPATAICEAIKKMRKVYKKISFKEKVLRVAADMSGLSRESLRRTLSSLVESRAICLSKTT